jgi:hypothetical protein
METTMDTMDETLGRLGVNIAPLSSGEKQALDEQGYLILPKTIGPAWLEQLRKAFEQTAGNQQSGTRHLKDLFNNGVVFEGIYTHPKVLAAVYHILRCPFRVGQLSGRDPLPGYGQQGLHADWLPRVPSEPFRIVTALWLLDDFTPDNGATRLVPGTHRLLTPPPKNMAAPTSRHPNQILVVAGAGSVLAFNGHLWHSGTRNETSRSRRVLQCQFVARNELRFNNITHEAPESLSPIARFILGV